MKITQNTGVCSIVLISAVLYRVGINISIVFLWETQSSLCMNWHKIEEIEHIPGEVSDSRQII